MRINRTAALCLLSLLAIVPAFGQVAGGGTNSGLTTAASTSGVTITIPTVIAVDVETDIAFTLATGGSGHAGAACDGFFPPAPGCTGAVVFNPTVTHTATAIGQTGLLATPSANSIWLAVFSNKSPASTVTVQAALLGASAPTTPATQTRLVLTPAAANSGTLSGGGTKIIAWGATATSLGTTNSPFNWTRYDQTVQLNFADTNGNGGGVVFNSAAGYSGTLTFTASH